MSDAPQQSYAVLTQRGAPPWTCRASSPVHAFDRWLANHPQRERNLRFGPRETIYSGRLARYTWTEHVQTEAGHTVVVRGEALVCSSDHVTPSDLSGDTPHRVKLNE
jgi:hypothetical protein